MADETMRLELEAVKFDQIPAIRQSLETLNEEAADVAAAFGRGELALAEYDAEMKRIDTSVANLSRTLKGLESAQAQAANAAQSVVRATGDIAPTTRAAQQGFLDMTRAAQDFAQGGIGGILNNLEGLGRGLPAMLAAPMAMFTSLPALATAAGLAIYEVYQHWDSIQQLWTDTTPLSHYLDAMTLLKIELTNTGKELDKLREKESLTADEIQRLNFLTEKQTRLEAEQSQARETEANRKRITKDSGKEGRERAASAENSVQQMGGYERTIKLIVNAEKAKEQRGDGPAMTQEMIEAEVNAALRGDETAIYMLRTRSETSWRGQGASMLGSLLGVNDPKEQERQKKAADQREKGKKDAEKKAADKVKDAEKEAQSLARAREQYGEDRYSAFSKFASSHRNMVYQTGDTESQAFARFARDQADKERQGDAAEKDLAARQKKAAADEEKKHKLRPMRRGGEQQRTAMEQEQFAREIYQHSQEMTGVQFTPQQARAAAKRSLDMQAHGAGAIEATQGAMVDVLQQMEQMNARLNRAEKNARKLQSRARTMQNRAN